MLEAYCKGTYIKAAALRGNRCEVLSMIQQAISNLQMDIALVQLYINNARKTGFGDMSRLLEGLAMKLFSAAHGMVLHNENLFQVNFPAIDLADDTRKTAIQVTSNATPAKVLQTIAKFEKHRLDGRFNSLIVFGFVKAAAVKKLPAYCKRR